MSYPLALPSPQAPLLTLTHPKPFLWIIEIHNGHDNRLTSTVLNQGFKPALDAVERDWREQWRTAKRNKDKNGGKGAVIIVGRRDQDKFFSNVCIRLRIFVKTDLTLELAWNVVVPTIAAINGHCFAGAFMLSLVCDYRVMTDGSKRNAWMCMNEVHFGSSWPLSIAAILRSKVGDHRLQRKIALEGHRFTQKEALEAGLVDHLVTGNTASIVAKAEELAQEVSANAKEGVWGLIKCDLYRDTLESIEKDLRSKSAAIDDAAAKARL
ncbi:ClpP/crotonase [Tricholoma matsutake]|nr:ClpP/crotonase [Tricholoma matsutake 945]